MDVNPRRERTPVPVRGVSYAPERAARPETPAEGTFLSYAWIVIDYRWTVAAVVAAAICLAGAYLFLATPVYEARSVVQVEPKRRALGGIDESLGEYQEAPASEPEIEIIRSRMLIGSVVDQLQLGIDVKPRTFPLVGRAIARRYVGDAPAPPLLTLSSYAWGGERIKVQSLEVPERLLGTRLLLTALPNDRYSVSDEDGNALLEGAVGANVVVGEGAHRIQMSVAQLVARPGTQFWLSREPRDRVIDGVQHDLIVEEKGKRSGVLTISMAGSQPAMVADLLNGIAGAYLRQNVERRSAEAVKTLEFLESQLPKLKSNVDAAEANLNAYRVRSGTVDTSAETKGLLDRQAQLEKEIADAEVQRSQLRQQFTEKHPNVIAVANKLALLRGEQAQLATRMKSFPKAEVDTARLFRELKDATDLYVALLNKAQELRVVKSGTIGDVRIIDRAYVPEEPASPRRGIVLALAMLLGAVGGVAVAIMRHSVVRRADTADDVEAATGLPVYVAVPHSDAQSVIARAGGRRDGPTRLLARDEPTDTAVEAIRSLRTTLQFALVESQNNIVALTGPSPGVGKSFIATNLTHVLAAAGSKVLLVDCDLRRGRLHRQFGLDRRPGISDVVSGAATLEDALQQVPGENIFVLPTGRIPPNPAELLSSTRFQALLKRVSEQFELVVVDTPPLLAVTDAILVARFAGVSFLVLRAGMHSQHEIAAAVKEFTLNGIKLHGTVLNDVRTTRSGLYGRSGYVRYTYTSQQGD